MGPDRVVIANRWAYFLLTFFLLVFFVLVAFLPDAVFLAGVDFLPGAFFLTGTVFLTAAFFALGGGAVFCAAVVSLAVRIRSPGAKSSTASNEATFAW